MPDYSTFSVLFFILRIRSLSDDQSIYARITVDGKRTEISLKRSIPVNGWDASKGRARGNSQNARTLNGYLDKVYSKLLDCHTKLVEKDRIVSPKAIKSLYLGLDQEHKSLKDLIEYHNCHMVSVLQPGTMKNYYTTEKYLYKFLKQNLGTDDIYLKHLNYRFITDYERFLRSCKSRNERKTCGNNGAMKHLERLKKMVNLAVKLEWIPKNPFVSYQLKFQKFERHYLNEHELKLLEGTIFSSPSLEKVKDIFLFSCFTGLSYIDIRELTGAQIVKNINGNDWVYTRRAKTNETVKIPLLRQARDILNKYQKNSKIDKSGFLFPVISNQKMNAYLKDIAASIKIRKNITFHSARHTFATTVTLANGVPLETVSKLLGHTKLATTQIYARVLEQKLGSDMEQLEDVFERKRMDDNVFPKKII